MEAIIAPKARSDIANILVWTDENFGPRIMQRYAKLIKTAFEAIAANPQLDGSVPCPEVAKNCRTYHLFHSRKKAGTRENRILKPRHLLLYRIADTGIPGIGRVLHDSMQLERHLPEDYREVDE